MIVSFVCEFLRFRGGDGMRRRQEVGAPAESRDNNKRLHVLSSAAQAASENVPYFNRIHCSDIPEGLSTPVTQHILLANQYRCCFFILGPGWFNWIENEEKNKMGTYTWLCESEVNKKKRKTNV